VTTDLPFHDSDLSIDARLDDLLPRLTLAEKAAQMLHEAPAIARLRIPAYNWWNECLHGVARAGIATVFPQAIALAATFDADRVRAVATAIADEARAKHHEYLRRGDRGLCRGGGPRMGRRRNAAVRLRRRHGSVRRCAAVLPAKTMRP